MAEGAAIDLYAVQVRVRSAKQVTIIKEESVDKQVQLDFEVSEIEQLTNRNNIYSVEKINSVSSVDLRCGVAAALRLIAAKWVPMSGGRETGNSPIVSVGGLGGFPRWRL